MAGEFASSEGAEQVTHARRAPGFLKRLKAPQLFALSFLLLIVLGTLALKLPGVVAEGHELSWLDALFTSTSAVCVTGLIVVSTENAFTTFGQAVILLLIQLGGLGLLSFTAFIILALGRRTSLELDDAAGGGGGGAEVAPQVDRRHVARNILLLTLAAETLGFLALWGHWGPTQGWRESAWPALFHSISAFCNAGFSTSDQSLVPYQSDPLTLAVVMTLIILGGLGFLTTTEVFRALLRAVGLRRGQRRLSLHAKLTLATTALLLVGGWAALTYFEWDGQLDPMSPGDRLVNGLFMSVTARTAGFNTIDYAACHNGTNLITIALMFAGGAAGGTAGGIKVTTLALIALLAWNRVRGRRTLQVFARTVPGQTADRAVGVTAASLTLTILGLLVLTRTELFGEEPGQFLKLMFEAFSAFNTVGLSMGQTGELSAGGRWVVIVMMFVGRIGPLTAAAAIAKKVRLSDRFRYAYEDVVVG